MSIAKGEFGQSDWNHLGTFQNNPDVWVPSLPNPDLIGLGHTLGIWVFLKLPGDSYV